MAVTAWFSTRTGEVLVCMDPEAASKLSKWLAAKKLLASDGKFPADVHKIARALSNVIEHEVPPSLLGEVDR